MTEELFTIGVSGGHAHSTAFAIDANDCAAACVTGPSLNHHMHGDHGVTYNLDTLFEKLASEMRIHVADLSKRTKMAVFAIPGASTTEDQALIRLCLVRHGWSLLASNYRVVDDAWAGLVAGANSYVGICAIAGANASVYVGENENLCGKPHIIDGWGHVMGDAGSSFHLALDMCRFLTRYYDEYREAPEFFARVLAIEPKIGSLQNLQRWFDTVYTVFPIEWRIIFSSLAQAVMDAADASPSDPIAAKLVRTSAEQMASSIKLAIKSYPAVNGKPIIFQGSMFEKSDLYRNIVRDSVGSVAIGPIIMSRLKLAFGALIMARFPNQAHPDEAVIGKVIATIPDASRQYLIREKAGQLN